MTGTGDSKPADPIAALTKAIVLASEAGQWAAVEALAKQLAALTAAKPKDAPTGFVSGARTIRVAG